MLLKGCCLVAAFVAGGASFIFAQSDAEIEIPLPPVEAEATLSTGKAAESSEDNYVRLLETFLKTGDEEVTTKVFRCQYISAETARRLIENFLTPAGTVARSEEDDIVVVADVISRMPEIEKILSEADRPVPQVLVEARIVEFELSTDFDREVEFGFAHTRSSPAVQNVLSNLLLPGSSGQESLDNTYGTGGGSAGRLWTFAGNDRNNVWALIRYLETKNRARLLSSPNLVIRRGADGNINTGEKVPIETQTMNGSVTSNSVRYENVGVKLIVRPIMIAGERIRLRINPEVSNVSRYDVTSKAPYISLRSATTELEAVSGEMIVIGGLLRNEERLTETAVPYLSKIPLLGWLFRGETRRSITSQLVIFVTPYVVTPSNRETRELLQTGVIPDSLKEGIRAIEENLNSEGQNLWSE